MASSTLFLVIFSAILFGLCGTTFSNQQEVKKTIQTKHGVYDCVDFYKQPAFSHPLLKNHAYKLQNLEELQEQKSDGIELKDGGCPLKTVPILRSNPNSNVFKIQRGIPDTHCVALVHTNNPEERKFLGVAGELENYKPIVYPNQWSSTRIKILNQNDNIEVGWMVNPDVFQDNEAHLYASFVALARQEGCINLLCPGFVQVAKDVPLGISPANYSEYGGTQYGWHLSIDKHEDDKHYWVSIITDIKKVIGYYPKELFSFPDYFSQVEWGGEISNPKQSFPPPEMGNGKKALYNPFYTASIMHASYVDWNYTNVLNPEDTHKVWDCEASYTVKDAGWKTEEFGRLMLYGGFNER
ncbi:uncharacterized protein LOC110700812 [Chenopodium quinoa]|uniref:uncharacterized protein LOC110700812 n=1 Tax=Chenopodium quinoa TaxID=63459 RepID=UPI000B78F027|nr:uncharacterized protein LOC110700812 [Chenopodium quinoa]